MAERTGYYATNEITVEGRLGADPELKYMKDGTGLLTFNVAVQNGEETMWCPISVWGDAAEKLEGKLSKGDLVLILKGRLHQRSWTDDEGNKHTKNEIRVRSQMQVWARPGGSGPAGKGRPRSEEIDEMVDGGESPKPKAKASAPKAKAPAPKAKSTPSAASVIGLLKNRNGGGSVLDMDDEDDDA